MKCLILLLSLLSFNVNAFTGVSIELETVTNEAATVKVSVKSDIANVERMASADVAIKAIYKIRSAVAQYSIADRVLMSRQIAADLLTIGVLAETVTLEFMGIKTGIKFELNPNFIQPAVDLP